MLANDLYPLFSNSSHNLLGANKSPVFFICGTLAIIGISVFQGLKQLKIWTRIVQWKWYSFVYGNFAELTMSSIHKFAVIFSRVVTWSSDMCFINTANNAVHSVNFIFANVVRSIPHWLDCENLLRRNVHRAEFRNCNGCLPRKKTNNSCINSSHC